ncbi:hypothetical protein [Streptomyces sp. NPDC091212]|uniref:hypothetical protein n=1 Tax=Streptomyces sp. NPDC091212 TaxID=3155191 RepID=UPI00342F83A5
MTRCAEFQWLPRPLLDEVRAAVPSAPADDDGILRTLECPLPAAHGEEHCALVCELEGDAGGAVWALWTGSRPPAALATLPDCPVGRCVLWAGHEHGHQPRTYS